MPRSTLKARHISHRPAPARDLTLARWLTLYGVGLRQRLAQRLGLGRAAFASALRPVAQERPARIWVSPAEVVAVFDLEHHPVAWRLAGLDRDPGFLPSAACSLRFIFE